MKNGLEKMPSSPLSRVNEFSHIQDAKPMLAKLFQGQSLFNLNKVSSRMQLQNKNILLGDT
jgi:hypothetical protein